MLSLIEFWVSWRESLNYKGYGAGASSSERQMAEAAREMAPFDSLPRPVRRTLATDAPPRHPQRASAGIVRRIVIGRDL
jgi:hypothetical protein